MNVLLRVLKIIAIVLVAVVVLGGAGGYWFATKSHPQINGEIRVPGLKAKVEVVRDPLGVPHIYASNADDLFFAQGYVQAQDRLWQMELFRHIGQGRTAELSGKSAVGTDKFLRNIGIPRAALADWQNANDEEKRVLSAFAAGVNAFIESHHGNLPIEYTFIGITPEPWQPVDSIVWAKMMAYDLGGNRTAELVRSNLIAKLGADKVSELMPPNPASGPFIIPTEAKNYTQLSNPNNAIVESSNLLIGNPNFAAIAALDVPMALGDGIGSNNWVIDSSKSATGKPIVANDPHLGIQMPSIWYELGLHCQPVSSDCPYNVVGMGFAPLPTVVAGHNDRIAWGVTNTGPDVQDYFVEKINPANQNQYEFQSKWEDFTVVHEKIKVKGSADETLEVKISRHGPIMTPVLDGVTAPLALQWTATRERSHIITAILQIDRAQNWDQFRSALKFWNVPAQNFVYADVDGNIGYQMPSDVPIRSKGDGSVPAEGWSGDYEWKGYIPFEELPFVYNPPTHYIATANQQVVPSTYKYLITRDFSAPFRAMRINELLKSKDKLGAEDFQAIQGDLTSIPMLQLQKAIAGLTLEKDNVLANRAMDTVKSWNGKMDTESVGGTILEATYARLMKNILGNRLDQNLLNAYLDLGDPPRLFLYNLLAQNSSSNDWWSDANGEAAQGRDEFLKKSFVQSVDDLRRKFGETPTEWKWGRLHTATFAHPVGSVQPLNLIFNVGPIATSGNNSTVNVASYRFSQGYAQTSVPSMRLIQDVGDWNRSLQIHTTGESGQPFNKHYSDLVPLWRDVKYAPLYFDRAALDKMREGILVLQP